MSVKGVMYRNKTTKGSDLMLVRSIERTLEWSRFLESSFPSFIKKIDWLMYHSCRYILQCVYSALGPWRFAKSWHNSIGTQFTLHISSLKVPTPPSLNIRHSEISRIDYVYVEKTLLPLIIKHWNSVWVTKYVLINVACSLPCTFLTCTFLYMIACTFFFWKKQKTIHN